MKIPFNKPAKTGDESEYISRALASNILSGDGPFSSECQAWFETNLSPSKVLLTPNCTQALEMAAILIDIKAGDEVIMPSYTFVSTANAFVLRGAKIKFVDIDPLTMNIDDTLIEQAISDKTKAIVVVHYAGIACNMDNVMSIAKKYGVFVIEDAAQAMMSKYKGQSLGTIGDFGAYSFHETKNYTSGGEGGLLIVNNPTFFERAEIIREKGTNRSQFFRGMVNKYSWQDIGSSFLPSELQAAYLYAQLNHADKINQKRLQDWNTYKECLAQEEEKKVVMLPKIPQYITHNAHMFYLLMDSLESRSDFISYMRAKGIMAVFHYVPLHSSIAGQKYGEFIGEDQFTTNLSERLVRLPLFYQLSTDELNYVCNTVKSYFRSSS